MTIYKVALVILFLFLVACSTNPVPKENATECVNACRTEWKSQNDSNLYWQGYWYVENNKTMCECYIYTDG